MLASQDLSLIGAAGSGKGGDDDDEDDDDDTAAAAAAAAAVECLTLDALDRHARALMARELPTLDVGGGGGGKGQNNINNNGGSGVANVHVAQEELFLPMFTGCGSSGSESADEATKILRALVRRGNNRHTGIVRVMLATGKDGCTIPRSVSRCLPSAYARTRTCLPS